MAHSELVHVRGDVGPEWLDAAMAAGQVAWDIETSGLDWRLEKIRTCQVALADRVAVVQLIDGYVPENLRWLLEDPGVRKVFHHAPFDLRFMAAHWKVAPASVACTKVASKIVRPGADPREYSLKPVLKRYLNVDIDKGMQVSNWSRDELTKEQLAYAANDVRYLQELLAAVFKEADRNGVSDVIRASFDYLPTRVELDLLGAGDVFAY
jgi:ribonuclease D